MSIDTNAVVTNGMLARYDAGIKDIIAMRTAEKNPVRYKVVKSTSTGSQTYSFYKKDENDTQFVVDSTSDAITVQDSIDSTSTDPVNGVAVAAEFASQMTTQNINSIIGYTPMDSSIKGAANGVASLDGLGQVPLAQLPVVDTYSPSGTKPMSGTGVAAALATLPEPMVFKGTVGTGGTVTSLPTAANSNKGHTYKAISDNITSGSKVGDTFISTGSEWVVIPSGDEPSGTVTQVGINASSGSHLSASGTVNSSGNLTVGVESGYQIPTSSDVSQITTNKTNILYTLGKTGRNHFDLDMDVVKKWNTGGTWSGNTYTEKNVTFTFNDDKTISVSGTANGNINLVMAVYYHNDGDGSWTRFKEFDGLVLSGCPAGGAWNKYSLNFQMTDNPWTSAGLDIGNSAVIDVDAIPANAALVAFYLSIYSGYPTSAMTFKPMCCTQEDWSLSHEYTPYRGKPNYDLTYLEAEDRAALAEVVDSGAKQLLNYSLADLKSLNTSGTWTDNVYRVDNLIITYNDSDKTISVQTNGSATTQQINFTLPVPTLVNNQNYVISAGVAGVSSALTNAYLISYRYYRGSTQYAEDVDGEGGKFTYLSTDTNRAVYIVIRPQTTMTTKVFKPMICTKAAFGISKAFVPYRPNYDLVLSDVDTLETKSSVSFPSSSKQFFEVSMASYSSTGRGAFLISFTSQTRTYIPALYYVVVAEGKFGEAVSLVSNTNVVTAVTASSDNTKLYFTLISNTWAAPVILPLLDADCNMKFSTRWLDQSPV